MFLTNHSSAFLLHDVRVVMLRIATLGVDFERF